MMKFPSNNWHLSFAVQLIKRDFEKDIKINIAGSPQGKLRNGLAEFIDCCTSTGSVENKALEIRPPLNSIRALMSTMNINGDI